MILTNSEIMDINQNAEFDSAIGFARAIESAVLEKLKAQSVKSPDNGKWNTGIDSDGRVFLQSDDFNHDVRLYVNGDFDGNTTDYADRLAAFMNSHPLPPADVVRDAERYRFLRDESYLVNPVCAVVWKRNDDREESEWVNTVDGYSLDCHIDDIMKEMK